MRIYSFFARQRAKRQQFKYDMTRVLVSLKFRPRNWRYHYPYVFENPTEGMRVWVANELYGLDFRVDGRTYGNVVCIGWLSGWRRKVMRAAKEAGKSPWVKKWGVQWDRAVGE